jgi:hypothetical protein
MILAVPPYIRVFEVGDVVICKTQIDFTDGTKHVVGQRNVVTEETQAYYNVCSEYYEKGESRLFDVYCKPNGAWTGRVPAESRAEACRKICGKNGIDIKSLDAVEYEEND